MRYECDLLVELDHSRAVSDQTRRLAVLANKCGGSLAAVSVEGSARRGDHFIHVERLAYVIEGSLLNRLHRRLERPKSADQYHLGLRRKGLELLEQGDAVCAAPKIYVADDQVKVSLIG